MASAIGSGIGGGLRRPTAIGGSKAVANTASNHAASNGINGHGITATKIQNKYGGESKVENNTPQPSLMGKFGKQTE